MSMPNEPLPPSARRVVLVDARNERRLLMRRVVEGDDETAVLVGEADSMAAALAVVEQERADVVLLDVQMPVSEGLATIAALRERYPKLGIVVCSFDLDRATAQRALDHGADSCLAKPVNRSDVHNALRDLRHADAPRDDQVAEGRPDAPLNPLSSAAAAH